MKRIRFVWVSLMVLAIIGCGGGGGSNPPSTGPANLAFHIVWPTSTRLIPQLTKTIFINVTKGSGFSKTIHVSRESDTETEANVTIEDVPLGTLTVSSVAFPYAPKDENGSYGVELASGSATVETTAGKTVPVTIEMSSSIAELRTSPKNPTIRVGDTFQATAGARTSNDRTVLILGSNLHWTSENASVATVDPETEIVTGVGKGSTKIVVTESESGVSGKISVTVIANVGRVTLSPTSATLIPTERLTLTATAYDTDSKNMNLSSSSFLLTSSDNNVVTVNGNTVTAVAPGTATITAKEKSSGVETTVPATITVTGGGSAGLDVTIK